MDIERTVAARLAEATGIDAYLEVPNPAPDEFLCVEQTGGGGGFLDPVQLDVDCWAAKAKGGRKRARAIAEAVRSAVADLDDEPNMFHPTVETFYRMPDPDTGRPRYTVGIQVWICE